jgi:hypothetical protein
MQLSPHRLRFLGSIYRYGRQVRAHSAQRRIDIAVFRQLAETERSPVSAIKKKNQRPTSGQFRKPPFHPHRIGKLELRRHFSHMRHHPRRSRLLHTQLGFRCDREGLKDTIPPRGTSLIGSADLFPILGKLSAGACKKATLGCADHIVRGICQRKPPVFNSCGKHSGTLAKFSIKSNKNAHWLCC